MADNRGPMADALVDDLDWSAFRDASNMRDGTSAPSNLEDVNLGAAELMGDQETMFMAWWHDMASNQSQAVTAAPFGASLPPESTNLQPHFVPHVMQGYNHTGNVRELPNQNNYGILPGHHQFLGGSLPTMPPSGPPQWSTHYQPLQEPYMSSTSFQAYEANYPRTNNGVTPALPTIEESSQQASAIGTNFLPGHVGNHFLVPGIPASTRSRTSEESISRDWNVVSGSVSSSSWGMVSREHSSADRYTKSNSASSGQLEQPPPIIAGQPLNGSYQTVEGGQSSTDKRPTKTGPIRRAKVSRRTGPLKPEARAKAAMMRKNKPCVRCHIYHVGCDGNNPCTRCQKSLENPRTFHQPCWRADLKAIALVRHGNGRFHQHDVQFLQYDWVNVYTEPEILTIRRSIPDSVTIEAVTLEIPVRKYVPGSHDTTSMYWQSNGVQKSVELPAYAGCDDSRLLDDMETFMLDSQPELERWIWARHKDDMTRLTYDEAVRYHQKHGSELVVSALRMQAGAIMSQGWGAVINDGLPELPYVDFHEIGTNDVYDSFKRTRSRPLPLAMEHQIDTAILKTTYKFQKTVLAQLDRHFTQPNPKPWYEIFLTFFILISNLEWVYEGTLKFKLASQKTMLESQVNGVVKRQVEEYCHASKVMLYYFRCIFKGPLPFQMARKNMNKLRNDAQLDDAAVTYLEKMLQILDAEGIANDSQDTSINHTDQAPKGRWVRDLFRAVYQ